MSRSSGLGTVVKLLLFVAVVYFAVTEGLPWARRQFGGGRAPIGAEDAGGGDAGHCVALASEAGQALGQQIRRFRNPPYDLAAWDDATAAVDGRVAEAESACGCPRESCERAAAALAEVRDLVASVDGVVRGDPTAFRNPGSQQERIDDLIAEARDLARQGR
jgi:hypothetical protein